MQHIDLFEAPDGDLYMVPDEGDRVYGHRTEAKTDPFAYVARHIIADTDGYRDGYGNVHNYASVVELLGHPDTIHIADYTCVIDDREREYTEHQIHFYGRPKETSTAFLGTVCGHIALGKPLPQGPICGRCVATTKLIAIYDVAPYRSHREIQHTIMYQCPACGYYRQIGFEDGTHWTGEKLSFRILVRLFPDPFVKTGRLRMTYEAGGRRLNIDGESLRTGQAFEVFSDGAYRGGRVEIGSGDRFYFIFSGRSRPDIDLLPGMRARLPN